MMRCAFFEMKRLPSRVTPRRTSDSISSMSEGGCTTTPQPITQRQPEWRMPEGTECSTYFSRPTTTVWPALLPPWYRTTTLTCGVMTSTTLPLPSSPHCAPTTTMLAIACSCAQLLEVPARLAQDLADVQLALAAAGQLDVEERAGSRARAAHHQNPAHSLGPRVGQRVVEAPADDVAGHRGPQVAQTPGQRQRRRLLGGEGDDEEVGAGQRHRHALRVHHRQEATDVEGEAHGRAVEAEAPQHLIVAAA